MPMIMALSAMICLLTGCEPDEPVNPVNPTLVVPKVSTLEVMKISGYTYNVLSVISNNGGVEITEAGICIANDTITPKVTGITRRAYVKEGDFSIELELSPNKTYTVCAYIKYRKITDTVTYGGCITFHTDMLPPPEPRMADISDGALSKKTSNSAYFSGTVIDSGYCHINEIGICWSKTGMPTINDRRQVISGTSIGDFMISANELEKLTDYVARIYVTNIVGTNYGEPISFYTYDSVVDVDGNSYYGVRIGDQVWLTENLKTTHFNNGDAIPYAPDDAQWSSVSGPAYCWYDNDETRANTPFGALYNWWVGADPRGVAPEGYHVPTVEECHEFGQYFGLHQIYYINNSTEVHYYEYYGGKSIRTNYAWIPICYGTNSSGFCGLPTGFRFSDGQYISKNLRASFWTGTSYDNSSAWGFFTGNESGGDMVFMQGKWTYKVYGKALRCVKN